MHAKGKTAAKAAEEMPLTINAAGWNANIKLPEIKTAANWNVFFKAAPKFKTNFAVEDNCYATNVFQINSWITQNQTQLKAYASKFWAPIMKLATFLTGTPDNALAKMVGPDFGYKKAAAKGKAGVKMHVKIHAKKPVTKKTKIHMKIKAGAKKPAAKKAGAKLSIKAGAKKPAAPKAGAKISVKAGAKKPAAPKAGAKISVKAGAKTTKKRRMQANTTPAPQADYTKKADTGAKKQPKLSGAKDGANLEDAKYKSGLKITSELTASPDQANPAKAHMIVAGLCMLMALLF